jgi:hypothetical protein
MRRDNTTKQTISQLRYEGVPGTVAGPRDIKKTGRKPRLAAGPCPLRHTGHIVIWEGNYTSGIFNIGSGGPFLEKISQNPPF